MYRCTMGRGKFLSRKELPPSTRSIEELERSWNPLVRLGLAFKKVRSLAPESQPSPLECEKDSIKPLSTPSPRPLVDINDVRKLVREKLGITKEISMIPVPDCSTSPPSHLQFSSNAHTSSSETTHVSSEHSYSSNPSLLPAHGAASGARVFDIGTVGHPILEIDDQKWNASANSETQKPATKYSWFVDPPAWNGSAGQSEMEAVKEFIKSTGEVLAYIQRWGLPETSWENKMPWHVPPPKILARGLQRPPQHFASEEDRLMFNRNARKRKPFLTGHIPTWYFMVANFALLAFLVSNPFG